MVVSPYCLDPTKTFPTLPRAPIVEAVLHWQSAPSIEFVEETLREQLSDEFPDYDIAPQHNIEAALTGSSKRMEFKHSTDWEGFRLTKKENYQPALVCQFKKDGLVFSRLAPYQNWDEFMPQAVRFWEKFAEIGEPQEIARLSTRYISQIPISTVNEAGNFIEEIPDPLNALGVSTEGFFYQYTAKLGDLPYSINLVRAVQNSGSSGMSLIVDISVTTTDSIPADFARLPKRLQELRIIKNDIFFTLMKDAQGKFGEKNK